MPMPIKNDRINPFSKKLQHCEDVIVAYLHANKWNIKKHNLYDFWKRVKKMEDAEEQGRHYDYCFFIRDNNPDQYG